MSFEGLMDKLIEALHREGFVLSCVSDFQETPFEPNGITAGKYKVLSVYIPSLYKQMVLTVPQEGIVIPCSISVIETYPGQIAIVPFNATELATMNLSNSLLLGFVLEVTKRLDHVISTLEQEKANSPDLVTSWT